MKFSAKTEYAVRALLELALQCGSEPIQAREIAHRQHIPERFLEQVLSLLKRGHLVVSVRGSRGGYLLSRPACQINMADIITTMEGSVNLSACLWSEDEPGHSQGRCEHKNACAIRDVWSDVQTAILDALKEATLEKICTNHMMRYSALETAIDNAEEPVKI